MRKKIIKKSLALILGSLMLLPSISSANEEKLVEVVFTEMEKEAMWAKGFDYRKDLGGEIDPVFYTNETNPPLTRYEMEQINEWCRQVYHASLASQQKTQTQKALYLSIYLRSFIPYDMTYEITKDLEDVMRSSHLRAIPYYGSATCKGFAVTLVRLLDIAGIESYVAMGSKDHEGHAMVRAYLDGKWKTIEATPWMEPFNFYEHLNNKKFLNDSVFVKNIKYVNSYKDLQIYPSFKTTKDFYVLTNKKLENYLAKNNFIIYDY